ncbi:MAG: 3-aminobutyryl-CoA ammonia-lyase [Chloroflexota bacterium]|nr:3-aminobutyryl-CoA ammonia-lyase [Chloroflexota bacterium]
MADLASLPDSRKKAVIYMRVAAEYGEGPEGFMGGWWSVRIIGELVTALGVQLDGDLSLLANHNLAFIEPVYAGDYLRFTGEIVKIGNTSRTIDVLVEKVIDSRPDLPFSEADYLDEPRVVIKGQSVIVVKKDKQRKPF